MGPTDNFAPALALRRLLKELLTITLYSPAWGHCTLVSAKSLLVAPAMFAPLNCH